MLEIRPQMVVYENSGIEISPQIVVYEVYCSKISHNTRYVFIKTVKFINNKLNLLFCNIVLQKRYQNFVSVGARV